MAEVEQVQVLAALQGLATLFLVLSLRLLYSRLRSEPFLYWWSHAWTACGIFLVAGPIAAAWAGGHATAWEALWLVAVVAGILQAPLLVLGALNLRRQFAMNPRVLRSIFAAAALLGIAVFAISRVAASRNASYAILEIPRQALAAAAYFYCAAACRKWCQETRPGRRHIAAYAFAVYGLLHVSYVLNSVSLAVSAPLAAPAVLLLIDLGSLGAIGFGVVSLVVDEHRRAVEARKESEARFGGAAEALSEGLMITDRKDIVLYANSRLTEMTGYTTEQMLGKPGYSLLLPPNQWPVMWKRNETRMQGVGETYEMEIRRKDGTSFWAEIRGLPYRNALDEIVGTMGTFTDVTERKKAQEALRASEEKFKAAFRAIPDAISIAKLADGTLVEVNEGFARLSGYSREEAIGRKSTDLGLWANPDERATLVSEISAKGTLRNWEIFFRRKNGEVRIAMISAERMELDGEPCIVMVATDITERKRSEGILRTLAETLSTATGEAFFRLLVQHVASLLGVDFCFVGQLQPGQPERVKTIAFWANGKIVPNIEYSLAGSPCSTVLGKDICFYSGGVAREFPEDKVLSHRNIESYGGAPLFGSAGQPLGLMSVMHTRPLHSPEPARSLLRICAVRAAAELERLRAEQAIRESEERYRLLVENSQGFICTHDLDGVLLSVNSAAAQWLGYEPAEMVGRNLREFLSLSVAHLFPNYLERILHNRTDSGLLRVHRKSGEERILVYRNFRYHEPGKEPYVLGHAVDITDQKLAEAALRESEERYRTVAQTATDCIVTIDANSKIHFANSAAERIFGYPAEELIGKDLTTLMPDYLRELHKRAVGRYVATGQRHMSWESVALPGLHRSGREIPLEVSFGESVKGGRHFFTGIIRDITERKQAEQLQAAVYRIAEASAKTGTLSELYRSVHEIIRGVMPAGSFYIALYDEKEDLLTFPYFVDEVDPPPPPRKPRRGVTEYVLRTGKSLLSTAAMHEELSRAGELELVGSMSPIWLGVPLKLADKTIGVMAVQHYTDAAAYGAREQGILEYVSSQLAKAIEQKRAQEALRQSEEKFSRAFHSSPDAMVISTCNDSRFIEVNEGFLRMSGYTREQVIGRNSRDLDLWVDRSHRERMTTLLRQSGSMRDFEFEMRTQSGETRTCLLSVDVIDVGGQRCFLSVVRDITDRKQMEEALRQSESKFSKAFFASPDAMAITTIAEGRFVDVNETFLRLSGYRRDELIGRTALEMNMWVNPDDRERVHRSVRENGSARNVECAFRTKSGEILIGLVSAESFHYSEEPCMLTVMRDITDRKQMEEALRFSEERYRELFENANDILYTHDLAGNFTSLNRAGELLTGYSREDSLRMNLADVVAPEHRDRAKEMIEKKLTGEGPTTYEIDILAKDGRRITMEASTRLILHEGTPIGVQGVARDISERRTLEAQLRQAQKMEAVGRLAGGVAHDFNNLLMVIRGFNELILDRLGPDDPMRRSAEQIEKAADRASGVTQQLLAYSRKQVLTPQVLDFNTVVENVSRMLRRLIGEDIELRTHLAPNLGSVMADRGQVEQVLLNLAVNARDAMPRGGTLTIETSNADLDEGYTRQYPAIKPGPYVMLAVSDTGIGISPEDQTHIFEPFFTTKEVGKGTGLGLAMVYGIVKQSEGYIWCYSEPGIGTSFKVYLPRVVRRSESKEPKAASPDTPLHSETILVVEDERSVRELTRQFLRNAGYVVLEAGDGTQALEIADSHKGDIHVLLTDVIMPGMSGHELAQKLAPRRPGMKVLYVSGYPDEAIGQHGVLEPGTEFLQKPFSREALNRKLRDILGDSQKQPVASP